MAISAQDVNKLRQMTGAGMMDCKQALNEANGDFEEAITILRKKGQKISAKRADREATEGAVFAFVTETGSEGYIFALNCETDFVAKNEEFLGLGNTILKTAVANKPESKEELLTLDVDGNTVADHITNFTGKIGEKIEVSAYAKVNAEKIAIYIHSNAKVGVILGLDGVGSHDVSELGKDITLQIASMKPVAIDKDGVDPAIIEREIEIGKEQARQEGKPENILEKIALGKLNKFYQDSTLLNQQFVKDNSKTIAQLIKEVSADIKVSVFHRMEIGA
ncbi:MAG: translation elongation factor Ts [Microscillaceae bacterium]|nr:translation elongation factor Ts [Microscillaceae bacterium]